MARLTEGRTNVTDMPSALHQLVGSVTDTYDVVAEHSRDGDIRPSLWEVNGPAGERWFAKQHVGPKLHRRECDAYRQWTVALGVGRAPELVAADGEERTILITAVPGLGLDRLRLPAEQARKAYEQAGELLARHHAAAGDGPTPASTEDEWGQGLDDLLARSVYAPEHDVALVRLLTKDAPPPLPRVASHGDYRELH